MKDITFEITGLENWFKNIKLDGLYANHDDNYDYDDDDDDDDNDDDDEDG